MPLLSSMKKCSAQFCVSAAYWAKYWTSQGTRKKMRLLMVGIYVYMYIYPFIPCNYMFKSRGWERPRGFNSCAVEMCECAVESAIFTLKFENSEISRWKNSSVISAWKVREKPMLSPWKCVNNLWFPSYPKKIFHCEFYSVASTFIANIITDPGDHGRARVSPESERKGTQGQNWSQWFWEVRAQGHLWTIFCFYPSSFSMIYV